MSVFQPYNCDHLSYNSAQIALKHVTIIKWIHTIILILDDSNATADSDAQAYLELHCSFTWGKKKLMLA